MAENYVEILVRSRDDAAPDLDRLKAKLEELSHETATARAQVDDADAAAKLDRMQAKLLDLGHRTANPKIRMSGALRAEAEIHAIEASLDHLNRKADELKLKADSAGPSGLIGRLLSGIGGGGGGGAPGVAGAGGVLSNPYGLAAIAGSVAALLPELTGLVSGFAAAGAGAAAFGVLAMPAVKKVETAYTGLSAAQAKYQHALDTYNADPTKAHAKSLHDAKVQLDLMNDSIKKMPASEQGAMKGVQQLVSEFGRISRAFEPAAFKVFADFLKIANNLLPIVSPFANTFADALDKLLRQVAKFTTSKGFQDWVGQFHALEGPAVTAIGEGIGKVVVQIGKLLTLMSAKDVVNAINIAFTVLAGTIAVLRNTVNFLMNTWDGAVVQFSLSAHKIASAFDVVRHFIASGGHDIANDFDGLRHAAADLAHNVAAHFDQIRHDIAAWADDVGRFVGRVVTFFVQLPGKIVHGLGNVGALLINAGRAIIDGLIHGIESGIGSLLGVVGHIAGIIASHKGPIEADLLLLVPHGQAIMQGLMNGMRSRFPALRAQLGDVTGMVAGMQVPAAHGYGGGGGQALQLQVTGGSGSGLDGLFMTWLKNNVRAAGGDPRMFNKKVAFL